MIFPSRSISGALAGRVVHQVPRGCRRCAPAGKCLGRGRAARGSDWPTRIENK